AFEDGLDVSRITTMAVVLRPAIESTGEALEIQTDTWIAEKRGKTYLAAGDGKYPFYVESDGLRLKVGAKDLFEIGFTQRGVVATGSRQTPQPPWLEARAGLLRKRVIGPPGTGLMLWDQSQLDAMPMQRKPDDEM